VAGQPRKPEAAHVVDWFYVTSSLTIIPLGKGDHATSLKRKRSGNGLSSRSDSTMLLKGGDVKMQMQ
jgi:hypothetical protein